MKNYIILFTIICALIVALGIYNYLRADQQIQDAYQAGASWGCLQASAKEPDSESYCSELIGE